MIHVDALHERGHAIDAGSPTFGGGYASSISVILPRGNPMLPSWPLFSIGAPHLPEVCLGVPTLDVLGVAHTLGDPR